MLYLKNAYLREFDATVTSVEASGRRVSLNCTAFYATGGGQPHDTGTLGGHPVRDVRKEGEHIWHSVGGDGPLPRPGDAVYGELDWDRRHALMRTHTALHVLCGVIWNEWGKAVTGGNMEPMSARMDFEFDPLPEGFGTRVEELVNAELRAARPIEVSFLPRGTAVLDQDLIRTKVSLIPESVNEIRVVDIVGLDKQADGGTHVRSTDEVGRVRVVKTESKGKANKRIRLEVVDADEPVAAIGIGRVCHVRSHLVP
jgi:misacylated tRNA(Ala) deacylase